MHLKHYPKLNKPSELSCSVPKISMRTLAIIALFISYSVSAGITAGGRGMLFGENHAFAVTATPSWVLDNQSGVSQGLHMVFYPKGETWSDSPVIVYGRAVSTADIADVKTQVEKTVNEFRKNGSPNYLAQKRQPFISPNGRKADLYFFSGDQWGNHEAAIYFRESDTINFLVFNSSSKEDFERYFGDFQQIAGSYRNLYRPTAKVTTKKLVELKDESNAVLNMPGGKEYETVATRAVGQKMANAMLDCTSYMRNKNLPAFSYFVRISKDGGIVESSIYPPNALSACFNGLMSDAHFPSHKFETFLLNIEMKITP